MKLARNASNSSRKTLKNIASKVNPRQMFGVLICELIICLCSLIFFENKIYFISF